MGFKPSSTCFIDDLLDFSIETVDDIIKNPMSLPPLPLTECEEYEELEWLSNKDVFPSIDTFVSSVETFADIIPLDTTVVLKHESPVSVLESSNSSFGSNNSNNSNAAITSRCSGRGLAPPIRRPRSRRFQRRQRGGFVDIPSHQWFELCRSIQSKKIAYSSVRTLGTSGGVTGRKCTHCGSEKTPQWRAGPDGPKTLCNACGVRFKSGRLCPEYRPANSPTFSSAVHSNSHRKIVEMRKMKQTSNLTINPVDDG